MDHPRANPRKLRLFLRDFRLAEASANFAEGQSLAAYFAHRRSYLTVLDAHWVGTNERAPVAVIRVAQILYASAIENSVPAVASSSAPRPRAVEIQADGGLLLHGMLPMLAGQRLADYLESAGGFVPLLQARLMRTGRRPRETNVVLGDIVVNQDGIQAVWEAAMQPERDTAERTAASIDARS
jgi:hypothetical protein